MNTRKIAGSVLILRCENGSTFPHFQPSGDTDVETAGIGSLTSCDKNEIVLAEMTSREWTSIEKSGAEEFEKRISRELKRDDLRFVHLLRAEERAPESKAMSFQDFRKAYRPPILVFSCACADGESRVTKEMSMEEFRASGGRVTTLGNLRA